MVLFAAPERVATWWPWPLTPLTAPAMASWLLGLGGVVVAAFLENDWARIRIATISYAVLGILQLLAVARYHSSFSFGVAGALYLAFAASMLLLGVYAWIRANSGAVRPRSA